MVKLTAEIGKWGSLILVDGYLKKWRGGMEYDMIDMLCINVSPQDST